MNERRRAAKQAEARILLNYAMESEQTSERTGKEPQMKLSYWLASLVFTVALPVAEAVPPSGGDVAPMRVQTNRGIPSPGNPGTPGNPGVPPLEGTGNAFGGTGANSGSGGGLSPGGGTGGARGKPSSP
jgi:hypothetical protein